MNSNTPKVLIIGAGIAGLAAANKLASHGISATILEARNRIGGRIWTDYSLGIPISLGAQWLHGTQGNPIATFADKLSLHYTETDFKQTLFFDRNRNPIAKEIIVDFFAEFDVLLKTAKEYAFRQATDIPLATALDTIANPKDHSSLWQDLYRRATTYLCLYNGMDAKYLSARYWDQEEVLPGGNFLLIDGFSPIVNNLAKTCDIRYNTVVKKISHNKKGITVTSNQGEFLADKIIVTVPLGVLKNETIQFDPELPSSKKVALAKLQMGILDALVLQFPKAFWPIDRYGMFFSDCEFQAIINLYFFHHEPILTARVAGDKAKELEAYSDEEWINKIMAELRQTFGTAIPNPTKHLIARWKQDPFAQGSYSYIPVNATGEELDILATPIDNRLFFAGEATHRQHSATVHGAYLSGLRAAAEIEESRLCHP